MNDPYRPRSARLAAVASVSLILALSGRGAEYTVHVVEPAVTDHMVLPREPLPPVCKATGTMRVAACRGEYEPASFVITAATPLTAVRIEVGQLRGPGGEWPQDAVDVRLVKEAYRPFCAGSAVMPTLLVHDDGILTLEPAPTPEDPTAMQCVAKGALRDTAELQPVEVRDVDFEHSCQSTGLLNSQIWDRPFVVPLTGVKLAGRDRLAVRVLNREAMGGLWKPVRLVLSPQELSPEQVRALIAIQTQKD